MNRIQAQVMFVVVCLYFYTGNQLSISCSLEGYHGANVVISGMLFYCGLMTHIWTGDTNPSLNPLRPDDTFMMDMSPIRHLTYWRLAHLWWVWYQLVTWPIETWWHIYDGYDTNSSFNSLRPGDAYMVVMIPTRQLTYWGLVTHIWSGWYQPVT